MTLLNPLALVFAALVPLIVVLYLLKLRRQPASVSTLMFWQRVTADNRRRALFQRLRQVLSLLLHLLIFGLLLFALARPELRAFRGTETGLSTVVILDARARMQSRASDGGTRFDQARRVAESYLRRASSRQPMALLADEGAAPRVVVGMSGEERALLDGLDTVRPTDSGGRIEDAVTLASELLAARPGGKRIVLVTDHPPKLPPALAATGEVEIRLVDGGGPRENVGITRLTARALPNSPESDEVLVETENFGTRRQAGNVELSYEARLIDVKPFDLAPGERRTDIYPALAANTGIANARGWLTAHLDLADKSADAFSLDDDAFAVVPPPRPVRVLLVTKGNWFLENLLRADDQITFDQLAPDAFQPGQAASFDVVVLDDFLPVGFDTPDALPAQGNFLFLHRAPFALADPAAPELEHPVITDLDSASPLLRLVNLRDATVLRAQFWLLPTPVPAPNNGVWRYTAPVRSLDHPLVIGGERGRAQRIVAVAFGAADSDLPLRVAFPLFIHNAVNWLAGREGTTDPGTGIRAGDTIRLAAGESLWTRPQREFRPISDIPPAERFAGPGVYQPLQNGFYLRHGADGVDTWLAVNTADREMSALNALSAGEPVAASGSASRETGSTWAAVRAWPPWVYLALTGFVICALEWWGFHRRRTE